MVIVQSPTAICYLKPLSQTLRRPLSFALFEQLYLLKFLPKAPEPFSIVMEPGKLSHPTYSKLEVCIPLSSQMVVQTTFPFSCTAKLTATD
jgi:hypothetical protein